MEDFFQRNGLLKKKKFFSRFCLLACFFVCFFYPGQLSQITRTLMFDAYTQVYSFVAATLFIFFFLERCFNVDIFEVLSGRYKVFQIPFSGILGALPGCGGAIMVTVAFARGKICFGALIAALTSTMGDAAFILIAQQPFIGVVVIFSSVIIGITVGYTVDALHKKFPILAVETPKYTGISVCSSSAACGDFVINEASYKPTIGKVRFRDNAFFLFVIPGLVLGIMQMMQVLPSEEWRFFPIMMKIVLAGVWVSFLIWLFSPVGAISNEGDPIRTRVSEETSFIGVWVVLAYFLYDVMSKLMGVDFYSIAQSVGIWVPFLAILMGFIPGCGPQIVVTTLYLQGTIPFSALMGNAVSNDGDALFPAIALVPRAAILATLYSAMPSFFIAYGLYFFAPDLFLLEIR
jgi:hypothetical protein